MNKGKSRLSMIVGIFFVFGGVKAENSYFRHISQVQIVELFDIGGLIKNLIV